MTTICFDMKTLASDSKASQGGVAMIGDHSKIYLPKDDEYWEIQGVKILAFALAGDPDVLPWVKEALEEGVTHRTTLDELPETDFVIIAVDELGQGWYFGLDRNSRRGINKVILSSIQGPLAAGSGMVVATAVMSIGKSAREAVEQAIRLDNHSGGAIQEWVYPGAPEVLSKRPIKVEPEPVYTQTEVNTFVQDAIKDLMDKSEENIQVVKGIIQGEKTSKKKTSEQVQVDTVPATRKLTPKELLEQADSFAQQALEQFKEKDNA